MTTNEIHKEGAYVPQDGVLFVFAHTDPTSGTMERYYYVKEACYQAFKSHMEARGFVMGTSIHPDISNPNSWVEICWMKKGKK